MTGTLNGISCVHHQIEHDLFKLRGIHGERRYSGQLQVESARDRQNTLADWPHALQDGDRIKLFCTRWFLARKIEQLPRERYTLPTGLANGMEFGLQQGWSMSDLPCGVAGANHHGQNVVEIMGYAAGEFITTTAILGTFQTGDRISVQFLGGWDDNTVGSSPNWQIRSLTLAYSTPPTEVLFEAAATVTRQGATAPFTYQWQRNDGSGYTDIATATAANYRFFATAAADFTANFRVLIGVPGNYVPSNAVKLVAPGSNPTLTVGVSGGSTVITYTATLQSAPAITGPWQNVTGATSPYTVPTTGTVFFRTVR